MLLASSWDPQDSLGLVPRLRPGPPQELGVVRGGAEPALS